MKAGSHRARFERQREHKRRERKRKNFEALMSACTGLFAFSVIAALLAALGRENALGLEIAAGIFALAFGLAARHVHREGGRDSLLWHVLFGLGMGLISAIAWLVSREVTWHGVLGGALMTLFLARFASDSPDRRAKRKPVVDEE